jgi:DNA-binding NarL/FixJ family response regulator
MSSPTIIIAEDHPMFRGALALTLRRLMPEAQLIEVASHGDLEAALVISGGAYAETISRARQLGAAAFIPKSASTDTIAQALAGVIRGESWFPEHEALPAASEPRLQDQLTTLTPQQFRVLKYLADGKLNKQIAEKLAVSEGTVRAHVTAILRKLGVSTRTQAALLVTEQDLDRDARDAS